MVVIGLWNYVLVGYVVLFIFSISIIVDGFFCANYSPRSNFYIINPPGGAGGDSYYSVGLFATTLGVADSFFVCARVSRVVSISFLGVVGCRCRWLYLEGWSFFILSLSFGNDERSHFRRD